MHVKYDLCPLSFFVAGWICFIELASEFIERKSMNGDEATAISGRL